MQLIDHFVSAEVSSGSSSGKSFREIFRLKAKEDLEGIRSTFRRKSFQRRQEALLRHLLGRGETIPDLSSMCLAELNQLNLDNGGGAFRTRYIQALPFMMSREGHSILVSSPITYSNFVAFA